MDVSATLLHHPFLFKGKPTHAQEVARTDQVPNARQLRDLHTFSSVTSLILLIQLRPRESFISTSDVNPVV